ncbi:MAG: hypothetical protein IJ386_00375 [Clostridia bacterium]|nr:hypothetical protein [Clostridia bacterium]
MDAAGYRGQNRIYEAARDLKERARTLCPLPSPDRADDLMSRIRREYERIAFADDEAGIRTADKLRALEMYRALSDPEDSSAGIVINYDYGDEG